jgi:hypothetical protein
VAANAAHASGVSTVREGERLIGAMAFLALHPIVVLYAGSLRWYPFLMLGQALRLNALWGERTSCAGRVTRFGGGSLIASAATYLDPLLLLGDLACWAQLARNAKRERRVLALSATAAVAACSLLRLASPLGVAHGLNATNDAGPARLHDLVVIPYARLARLSTSQCGLRAPIVRLPSIRIVPQLAKQLEPLKRALRRPARARVAGVRDRRLVSSPNRRPRSRASRWEGLYTRRGTSLRRLSASLAAPLRQRGAARPALDAGAMAVRERCARSGIGSAGESTACNGHAAPAAATGLAVCRRSSAPSSP